MTSLGLVYSVVKLSGIRRGIRRGLRRGIRKGNWKRDRKKKRDRNRKRNRKRKLEDGEELGLGDEAFDCEVLEFVSMHGC